jgi:hypothetical protein
MMTWVLPSALGIAAAACIGLIAAHLIARDRPVAEPLPTARFIPQRRIQVRTTSIALSDLLLLALRIAAVAAIGLGIAGPIIAGARGRVSRIVLVDRSRSVLSLAEVRDSIRAAGDADVIIAFDSAARTLATPLAIDSIEKSGATGSLSAALAAANAAAGLVASRADSIEVTLISPASIEEIDDATPRIRAAWPGRVRVMRVRPETASKVAQPGLDLPRDADDPVIAGLSLLPRRDLAVPVRIVRARLSRSDSAWGQQPGHVLVHWPAADSAAEWPKRAAVDAIGGVASASGAFVARLPRLWAVSGRAIARWADGEPAVVERAFGVGCIRDVAVIVDPASDVTLHTPFQNFSRALLGPCGGTRAFASADSATLSTLAGTGPLAAARSLKSAAGESSRSTPWLLALGALLLLAELAFRRPPKVAA